MKTTTPAMRTLRGKLRTSDPSVPEFGSREAQHEGSIMLVAQKEVVTTTKTQSIHHAAKLMSEKKIRRVFITREPGVLEGIVTAQDIVDFLGGGERGNLLVKKYTGDVQKASEEALREIMVEDVTTVPHTASVHAALDALHKGKFGALPVMNGEALVGVVTERDFVHLVAKTLSTMRAKDIMTSEVVFGTTGMTLADVAKVMVRNTFRRLPILKQRALVGIVTNRDVVSRFAKKARGALFEPVENFMNDPITIKPDTLVVDAATLMMQKNVGGLPVVENGKVTGILTERDILNQLQ